MVALSILGFLAALLAGVLIMRSAHRHAHGYADDKPQRFHAGHVPRLGGVAVAVGLGLSWWAAALLDPDWIGLNANISVGHAVGWSLVALPTLIGGLAEDLTHRLAVRYRLALTAASALLAWQLLGVGVPRLDLPGIDSLMQLWPPLGLGLALLAIAGLPHAFNLIDGYNGLAGTVALLVTLAIAHVALQVGDRQLAAMMVCLAGATGGFLVWNYPRGLIFAGDGGAYLWGVVIALAAITLVQRHAAVSPWFPMLLLMYPVWETLFSIYRKLARGGSPSVADALHFHQLIYRRIVRGVFHDDEARRMLMRNNRTSPYLWGFTVLTVVPAVLFWRYTPALMACCLLFVLLYVASYLMIVRFKVPNWLRHG